MKVQAVLNKIGYKAGPVDGIFGSKTEDAVLRFQTNNGIQATGVIGPKTWSVLKTYILGYDIFKIRQGDSLYKISLAYFTPLDSILTANPGLNPYNLRVGMEIKVPYSIDVVDTNVDYTYDILKHDIKGLKERYPFIEVGIAGKSTLGRNLYYVKLGKGPNKVFYNAAHHSLEWITTPVLMKFIEDFSKAYAQGGSIKGYNIRDMWNKSTVYIMPMVNPDGIDLVINGLKKDNPYYDKLIKWNNGSKDFSKTWNANVRGVDLNHNYDAAWQLSKESEKKLGIDGPGPTRYSGEFPESEVETKTVVNFTRKNNPKLVLAYHSQGEVIYWNFMNKATKEMKRIGEALAKAAGYELAEAYGITSYAGYKDWVIDKFGTPGYTVEVGKGVNPLSLSQFDKIYKDNIGLLLLAAVITS
nr:M14 family metallopeptidase [Clostridium aestuarii]